jgi:hypothetical protein
MADEIVKSLVDSCVCAPPTPDRLGQFQSGCPPGCDESDDDTAARHALNYAEGPLAYFPPAAIFWRGFKLLYGWTAWFFGDTARSRRSAAAQRAFQVDTAINETMTQLSRLALQVFGGDELERTIKAGYEAKVAAGEHSDIWGTPDEFFRSLMYRWPAAVARAIPLYPMDHRIPPQMDSLCRAAGNSYRQENHLGERTHTCAQILQVSWRRMIYAALSAANPRLAEAAMVYFWREIAPYVPQDVGERLQAAAPAWSPTVRAEQERGAIEGAVELAMVAMRRRASAAGYLTPGAAYRGSMLVILDLLPGALTEIGIRQAEGRTWGMSRTQQRAREYVRELKPVGINANLWDRFAVPTIGGFLNRGERHYAPGGSASGAAADAGGGGVLLLAGLAAVVMMKKG